MKINIVSDIVCPWCIIGYKRLMNAITELGVKDRIELNWIPYELNPDMPTEGQNLQEHLSEKYGSTSLEQKKMKEEMTAMALTLGFQFNFYDGMRMFNTREAHILLDFAKEFDKQTDLNLRFMTAFYNEKKNIANQTILLDELEAVGLDRLKALERLKSEEAKYSIVQEEKHWQQMGVKSTPTFIFEDMSAIPGAQPEEVFKNAISNLLKV